MTAGELATGATSFLLASAIANSYSDQPCKDVMMNGFEMMSKCELYPEHILFVH